MSNNQLESLVAEAEQAAENFQQPASPSVPAVAPAQTTALSKPSLDNFLDAGGLDVDEFVRLNDSGFKFGDKMQGLFDEAIVTIDMSTVTPIHSFRYEVGGNTKFLKSYDGVTSADGMNFQQQVAQAAALPGAKTSGIYPTVEIPMVLTERMEDPKKGSTVAFDAGTRIGYTPSVTGFKAFQAFAKKLRAENPELLRSEITVRITHAVRTNSNNNRWGVLEFERVAA